MSKSAGDYAHVEIGCSSPLCDVLCPCGFHTDLIRVIGEAQEESRAAGRDAALAEAERICEEMAEETRTALIALHVRASGAAACAALAVRIRALREGAKQ